MRSQRIEEARLRAAIRRELAYQQALDEGIFDDVQAGIKKLSAYVTKQFSSVAGKWAVAIKEKLGALGQMPDDVKAVFAAVKAGMQETGESLPMTDAMKSARELGKFGPEQSLALVQQDMEGPVKEKAQSANEGFHVRTLYRVLSETEMPIQGAQRIDESLTATGVLGVGLAVMGGLPLVFKGLHKLAKVLGAEKTSHLFEKAYHVTHHFEEKVIDIVVPDKLSYFVYSFMWKKGMKLSKHHLEFLDFQLGKEGAMKRSQGLIYKAVLIYFAWNGLQGVLHAGASMLGFVEGTATTVKGIELARGATEVASLIRAGSGAAAAAAATGI